MRLVMSSVVFLMLVLGSTLFPAYAQDDAISPPAEIVVDTVAVKPRTEMPEERMVCRNEKPIGSHRAKRVCRSVADIEAAREETLEALNHRIGTPRLVE